MIEQLSNSWHISILFCSDFDSNFLFSMKRLTSIMKSSLDRCSFFLINSWHISKCLLDSFATCFLYQGCEFKLVNLANRIVNYTMVHKNKQGRKVLKWLDLN